MKLIRENIFAFPILLFFSFYSHAQTAYSPILNLKPIQFSERQELREGIKYCSIINKASICFTISESNRIADLYVDGGIPISSRNGGPQLFCETLFGPHYRARNISVMKGAAEVYDILSSETEKNQFFRKTRSIKDMTCLRFDLKKASKFQEDSRSLGINILKETLQRNVDEKLRFIFEGTLKKLEKVDIIHSENIGDALARVVNSHTIYLSSFVYQHDLNLAASILIHEAVHTLGYRGGIANECLAEKISLLAVQNSPSSKGITHLGYKAMEACEEKDFSIHEQICGSPIFYETNHSISSEVNHSPIGIRVGNWIGGNEVCDRVVSGDLNHKFGYPFDFTTLQQIQVNGDAYINSHPRIDFLKIIFPTIKVSDKNGAH